MATSSSPNIAANIRTRTGKPVWSNMKIHEARAIAREWVTATYRDQPEILGTLFHGSIAWQSPETQLPPTSDIDILTVTSGDVPETKLGKVRVQGLLLEISPLAGSQVQSAEQVLAEYNLAGSFAIDGIITDPTGHLRKIQKTVARDFTRRHWVEQRAHQALTKVRDGYPLNRDDPFATQVNAWLFPTGITTHVLLSAGVRNPTVRRRYQAVRELLTDFAMPDRYVKLLDLLGAAQLSRATVQHHLDLMTAAFDATKNLDKAGFFFASDISDAARPIAVDGSQTLIDTNHHRDAVFWIVATLARCLLIADRSAPTTLASQIDHALRAVLADLGIDGFDDLLDRRTELAAFVPELWTWAKDLMNHQRHIRPD